MLITVFFVPNAFDARFCFLFRFSPLLYFNLFANLHKNLCYGYSEDLQCFVWGSDFSAFGHARFGRIVSRGVVARIGTEFLRGALWRNPSFAAVALCVCLREGGSWWRGSTLKQASCPRC